MKINKVMLAIFLFFITACHIEKKPLVSLKLASELENNNGHLISLHIASQNFHFSSDDYGRRCETESVFALTYATPIKALKDGKLTNEFRYAKDLPNGSWELLGHYSISKKDIFLLNGNKKIFPTKIFIAQQEYGVIDSSIIAFTNRDRHTTQYVSFPMPCANLATSNTKLIIAKIYKDDKIIKQNIEFDFIISPINQIYKIWLE